MKIYAWLCSSIRLYPMFLWKMPVHSILGYSFPISQSTATAYLFLNWDTLIFCTTFSMSIFLSATPMTSGILQDGIAGISHCTGYFSTRHPGNKSFCCTSVFRIMGKRNWISERRSWSPSYICPRDTGSFSGQTGWSYGTNITPSITSQFFSTYIDMFWCSGAITSQILRASTIFGSSKCFFSILFLNRPTAWAIVYSCRLRYT